MAENPLRFPTVVEWSHSTHIIHEEDKLMENHDYITEEPECRRGQHLQREERGTLKHLHRFRLYAYTRLEIVKY